MNHAMNVLIHSKWPTLILLWILIKEGMIIMSYLNTIKNSTITIHHIIEENDYDFDDEIREHDYYALYEDDYEVERADTLGELIELVISMY